MSARAVLKRIITEKKAENPRISLRWIAKRMGVSSGRLSEILSNKRPLTEYYIDKLQSTLKLSEEDVIELRRTFLTSSGSPGFGPILEEHVVNQLADWKPYALLSFLQTTIYNSIAKAYPTAEQHIAEIAKHIQLPQSEVTTLFDAMKAVHLIIWDDGRWRPQHTEATTGYDIPSEARKEGIFKDLLLAEEKLKILDLYERDFSSMTLTMDAKDFEKAKKLIREFRRRFVRLMEKGTPNGVYQMNIQFFPLTETQQKKESP